MIVPLPSGTSAGGPRMVLQFQVPITLWKEGILEACDTFVTQMETTTFPHWLELSHFQNACLDVSYKTNTYSECLRPVYGASEFQTVSIIIWMRKCPKSRRKKLFKGFAALKCIWILDNWVCSVFRC